MPLCNAIIIGDCRGEDGMYSYSRMVLFSAVGDIIANVLPKDEISDVYYIKNKDAEDIGGTISINYSTQEHYKDILKCEQALKADNIMLLTAPMPELNTKVYSKLLNMHSVTNADITVLCCESDRAEEFTVLRNDEDEFVSIGNGKGEKALQAVVFKKDVLVKTIHKEWSSLFNIINYAAENGARLAVSKTENVIEIVDGIDAYKAQKRMMRNINFGFVKSGVTIVSPETTFIAPDAVVEAGTVIMPNTIIKSGCKICKNAVIGPNSLLFKATIGERTSVNSSQVYESTIGENTTVGPFAYVRPECVIGDNARIGDFVELKKSTIGNGTKVSHLTYIGDAKVGERVNFGCGTVVVNYDGYNKNLTTIGDDAFIGCNTNLVSPVTVGNRAFTAAGATITQEVPDGALAVARSRQKNIEGWNDARRKLKGKK